MSDEAKLVLHGLGALTPPDRQDVLTEIERYKKSDTGTKKKALRESWEKIGRIVLGPTGTTCPCCGR